MYKGQNVEFEMTIPNMFSDDQYNLRSRCNCGFKQQGFFQRVLKKPTVVGYFRITNQHLEIRETFTQQQYPPQANLENAHESVKWVI